MESGSDGLYRPRMTVRARTIAIALFTLGFLWANLEAYPHPDGMSNIFLAYRFITQGSANIGGFEEVPLGWRNWDKTEGFPDSNRFAPATAVALTPAVGLAIAAGVRPEDVLVWAYVDKAVATLLMSILAMATYAAARRVAGDGPALVATFAAVAGTSLATLVGQRTWQHALGAATIAIAWLWLIRGRDDARWLARGGLPLAVAIVARYPLGVVWAAGLAYVALTHRRQALPYVLWSAGPLIFLTIYNAVAFGSATENSYGPRLWQWAGLIGLPGSLISPSRGLLVFSPFLIAGLAVIGRRALRREPLWIFALASFVGLWVVHGTYIGWTGSWSYGNRYLLEFVPVLATGVALGWAGAGERGRWALAAAIVFAVVIQVAGLLAYYHFWDGFNWDVARVRDEEDGLPSMWNPLDTQWWWTIRAAIATADIRAAIVLPVTLAFGYFALRAGLARPTPAAVMADRAP
jgi:hypothetical protein